MQKFYRTELIVILIFLISFSKDLQLKLEFKRYGTMLQYPPYEEVKLRSVSELTKSRDDRLKLNEILQKFNIIFSPVKKLHSLSRYVKSINLNFKFFVCALFDAHYLLFIWCDFIFQMVELIYYNVKQYSISVFAIILTSFSLTIHPRSMNWRLHMRFYFHHRRLLCLAINFDVPVTRWIWLENIIIIIWNNQCSSGF